MDKKRFVRRLSFALCCLFVLGAVVLPTSASTYWGEDGLEHKTGTALSVDEMEAYLNSDSYFTYINKYAAEVPGAATITVPATDVYAPQTTADYTVIGDLSTWRSFVGGDNDADFPGTPVLQLPNQGKATWQVDVPENAMYCIGFRYYTQKGSVNAIERKLYIDDSIPFSEARFLNFSKVWAYAYEDNETGFRSDLIGNSLTPAISQVQSWRTYYCIDSDGYYTDYYRFYLSSGTHTITLEAEREGFILSEIRLVPVDDPSVTIPSYSDYLAACDAAGATDITDGQIRVIQAERPDLVSDAAVYMTNDRSSAITQPSSSSSQLYNVIGANSYNSVGQWAAYTFTVSASGYYNIAMRYKQSTLEGMYICRSLKLWSDDGMYGLDDTGTPAEPFAEATGTRFDYEDEWQASLVGDGFSTFKFYFKEGVTYHLYLEVSLGSLAEQLQRVSRALTVINDCYLRILQLTGASPDANRDYGFSAVMPDVMYYLNYEALELADVKAQFERICGTTGQHLSTLELISDLLARMGTNEYEIPAKLSSLKSYLGTLGTWINTSRTSSMTVDYIQIRPVATSEPAPRAKAGFFRGIWFEISSFIHSFFTKYDQMGVTSAADNSDDALSVWLASGRDQSKIWRSLVDSQFSDYCEANDLGGIPVALKLITGGTLLPSILADKGPDVYMGLDSTTTINYAIRGAVEPIASVDGSGQGFADATDYLTATFHPAALNTVELLGKTYGAPQTMNFSMMFYRIDVLAGLGATLPETWEDLLSLLPALQANNLTAGLGNRANETINTTLEVMLYQAGGSMWRYDDPTDTENYFGGVYAGAQIGLDTNVALDVFQRYCRFYTDYSFSYRYDAANRFRTGEMPIVIEDYVASYNQLTVFATEIAGLWEFGSVPGTRRADGSLNYDTLCTVTNLVMPSSKGRTQNTRDNAWAYIKWNTGAEAQAEYGNRMVALIGPSAKYATANMAAISSLSWTTKEAAAIHDQLEHLSSIKNYPGSYIIARYVNFAFLDAYNNGTDPVDALKGYISAINAELTRKREEFSDSGLKTLKTGQTPARAEAENN
ncbi:MAG: extracellular solute-binding protein [Clostridia bacterium]|nr:extracellular solute-binding protein [Clostridia bacterium]